MMRDQVVRAEYTNADRSALRYFSTLNGAQEITREHDANAWLVVHQHVLVQGYDSNRDTAQPPMVDVTPKTIATTSRPQIAAPSVDVSALRQRIADLEATVAELSQPGGTSDQILSAAWDIEVAAEMAVLAMAPDGAVDADRKSVAVRLLTDEAQIRGLELGILCRSLAEARGQRNLALMQERLDRLRAGAG